MKAFTVLAVLCSLTFSQLSLSAEKTQLDVIQKSERFSIILADSIHENTKRAKDLKDSDLIPRLGNYTVKAAIVAEAALAAIFVVKAATAAPPAAELSSRLINSLFETPIMYGGGLSIVGIGYWFADQSRNLNQSGDPEIAIAATNGQVERMQEVLNINDLGIRNSSSKADGMSRVELEAYEKASVKSLQELPGEYIKSSQLLNKHMDKVIAEADPTKKTKIERLKYAGSDQLKYGELVQYSILSQASLADTTKRLNNDLRKEVLAVRAVLKTRN